YLCWERWGTVAFLVYCVSTVFMIFCSTAAVRFWPHPWGRLSILIACFAPLVLVLVWKIPRWITFKELRKELLFIPIIIILGILNIAFSECRDATLKSMALFLISGIGIFGVTSCLLNTKARQTFFLWLCLGFLLTLCVYGFLEYFNEKVIYLFSYHPGYIYKHSIYLFSYNPLPAGALLILLFVGPFLLFLPSSRWLRFFEISTVVFAIVLIVIIIGSRGPVLGLLVIALLFGVLVPGRKMWIIPLIALILVGTGYKMRSHLPDTLAKSLISHNSTLYRLENYYLACRIFVKKPIFGIGLHAPIGKYLKDHQRKFAKDLEYLKYVNRDKTFENTWLCCLVGMGGLFSIIYFALIIYLLRNLFRRTKDKPKKRLQAVLLLIPLTAFVINSMTHDSIVYPHINWIFHSLLGMIANFNET
ncbi:O-antigen ligase family protein, partial [bacterium]|nr:O-antigen ligase family protein [bacterium]